jgi:hypothetical protein
MTTAELNAAIAAGTMTVTKLPTRRPNPRHLQMTRVGGSRSAVKGMRAEGTKIQGSEAWGKKQTKQSRRRLKA